MSGNLKKRWTCPASVITHIFDGEDKGAGLVGFHSEADKSLDNQKMRISGQPDPVQMQRRMNGEVYQLKVEVLIGAKWSGPKVTTFFPHPRRPPHPDRAEGNRGACFTKENIIRWIEQALTKHGDSDRSSRAEWSSRPRAIAVADTGGKVEHIKINGVSCKVQYEGEAIASVYPSTLGA